MYNKEVEILGFLNRTTYPVRGSPNHINLPAFKIRNINIYKETKDYIITFMTEHVVHNLDNVIGSIPKCIIQHWKAVKYEKIFV